ncbi:reverse transcriptase domain-containing protein [Tanacetum coccineum]
MLERLCGNEYYCFLDGFLGFFQISIAPEDQENTTFTCPYGTFAYRQMPFGLCNAPATFQRCMTAIFHNMVKDFMEVFMDDFLVFDGIVLGHKISGARIEVDRAKIDVIAKLPYPTNVKGVRSFLGHVGFYLSKEDAKPRLIRWDLLLQGFDIEIKDKKGAENLAANHLSRLEHPDLGTFTEEEINDEFPDEHLMILKAKLNNDEPWLRGDKNFKAGDKVLLFNSRFKMHPGKLKSKWYGPNRVKTVHPYGSVEIIDKNGISFKVNGQRLKKYHDGHTNEEEKEVVELDNNTT